MSSRIRIAVGESLPSTSRQARPKSPASSWRSARPEEASSSSSGGAAAGIAFAGYTEAFEQLRWRCLRRRCPAWPAERSRAARRAALRVSTAYNGKADLEHARLQPELRQHQPRRRRPRAPAPAARRSPGRPGAPGSWRGAGDDRRDPGARQLLVQPGRMPGGQVGELGVGARAREQHAARLRPCAEAAAQNASQIARLAASRSEGGQSAVHRVFIGPRAWAIEGATRAGRRGFRVRELTNWVPRAASGRDRRSW